MPTQPLERKLGITREILELLARSRHPVSIVTKSALVLRDLDLASVTGARSISACQYFADYIGSYAGR